MIETTIALWTEPVRKKEKMIWGKFREITAGSNSLWSCVWCKISIPLPTCNLQNVSDEWRNNKPSAKLDTNTMKKWRRTTRSNLKKNNTDRLSFFQIIPCTNVIIVLLAGSIPACICASRRRIIVRDFPFPFSHFAIVVDDCVHSYWLEGLVLLQRNCCSAVNLKNDVCSCTISSPGSFEFLVSGIVAKKYSNSRALYTTQNIR